MRLKILPVLVILIFLKSFPAEAQGYAILFGRVTDSLNHPIELANVAVIGKSTGTSTDANGKFTIQVPSETELTVDISFLGYQSRRFKLFLENGEHKELNVVLAITAKELPSVEVRDQQIRNSSFIRLDPKTAKFIPTVSGSVESLLKTLPGVSSTNELSSQYSVRGGNFDENLVYVNGIEIYRPFLVRTGQQEGLSFVNSDLVSSLIFSAGGFDAKYGDKMSSVLDVQYRKPTAFAGSAQASLLGAQASLEGITKNRRFTYLAGVRYKTTKYILNALETKGAYKPNFVDVQGLITYNLTNKLELSLLAYYSRNSYKLVPESRETNFGTIQQAYRLSIFFDGQEVDRYKTYLGALTLDYKPHPNLDLKLITSAYQTIESETFDIRGQYWIGKLETAQSNEQSGNVVAVQGIGTFMDHARNFLNATVFDLEHKGAWTNARNYLLWGLQYQHEFIDDKLSEWQMIDSAGYSMPNPPTIIGGVTPDKKQLELSSSVKSKAKLTSNRYTGYVQNTWTFDGKAHNFSLTAGIRFNYWDYNSQFLVSPRATVSYKPNWKKDILFRFSTGYYYQPPFYREFRDLQGNLNPNIKAQESIHFVLGSDWNFKAWGRPFKFITEVYYKYLDDLIPYVVDNVRIRYYATNNAHGYATGIDMKVNGEFIKGIESWASLSIMKTMEDIEGDFYYNYYNSKGELIIPGFTVDNVPVDSTRVEPGYIPRPTDQRVNFAIYFQDYLPRNPSYQMHLTLIFGTGLPFGAPNSPKYKQTLRYPPYRRVDIGFSKQFISEDTKFKKKNPLKYIKNAWITLEVFNLLSVNNTVSYIWVTDINNRQYAVPNYLTPRQINLKLIVDF
jgi:hypothetical protein